MYSNTAVYSTKCSNVQILHTEQDYEPSVMLAANAHVSSASMLTMTKQTYL